MSVSLSYTSSSKRGRTRRPLVGLPLGFCIVDRGERITVGLLLAQVGAHRLGVAVLWERAIGARLIR